MKKTALICTLALLAAPVFAADAKKRWAVPA